MANQFREIQAAQRAKQQKSIIKQREAELKHRTTEGAKRQKMINERAARYSISDNETCEKKNHQE